jgi:hypothetical protein
MPKAIPTTTRTWMSISELPIQARLRVEHAGRWVAWAEDFKSVVAVADSYEDLRKAINRESGARTVVEWVPPVPLRPIDAGA